MKQIKLNLFMQFILIQACSNGEGPLITREGMDAVTRDRNNSNNSEILPLMPREVEFGTIDYDSMYPDISGISLDFEKFIHDQLRAHFYNDKRTEYPEVKMIDYTNPEYRIYGRMSIVQSLRVNSEVSFPSLEFFRVQGFIINSLDGLSEWFPKNSDIGISFSNCTIGDIAALSQLGKETRIAFFDCVFQNLADLANITNLNEFVFYEQEPSSATAEILKEVFNKRPEMLIDYNRVPIEDVDIENLPHAPDVFFQ